MKKRTATLWTTLAMTALTVACVGPGGGVPEERSTSEIKIGGNTLRLDWTALGWAGNRTEEGQLWVEQTGTRGAKTIAMDGELWALPTRDGGTWIGEIELSAKQSATLTSAWTFTTDLAFAIYHRPARTTNAWRSLECGIQARDDRVSGIEYYEASYLRIDLYARRVEATNISGNTRSLSFSSCGVSESDPEFAAVVFPRQNWGSMSDEYLYELTAVCDRSYDCPWYSGDPRGYSGRSEGRSGDAYRRSGGDAYQRDDGYRRQDDSYRNRTDRTPVRDTAKRCQPISSCSCDCTYSCDADADDRHDCGCDVDCGAW